MIWDLLTKLYWICYKRVVLLPHMPLMKPDTAYNTCVIDWDDLSNTGMLKKYTKVCMSLLKTLDKNEEPVQKTTTVPM